MEGQMPSSRSNPCMNGTKADPVVWDRAVKERTSVENSSYFPLKLSLITVGRDDWPPQHRYYIVRKITRESDAWSICRSQGAVCQVLVGLTQAGHLTVLPGNEKSQRQQRGQSSGNSSTGKIHMILLGTFLGGTTVDSTQS